MRLFHGIVWMAVVGVGLIATASMAKQQGGMWIGEAPFCDGQAGDCEGFDMEFVRRDRRGDGARCVTGRKVLCQQRAIPKRRESEERVERFRVLTYNVFVRPYVVSHEGQRERAYHIPRAVAAITGEPIDVVVLQEAFIEGAERRVLFSELTRAGFLHATEVLFGDSGQNLTNGGVFIASRWPIETTQMYVFENACTGSDCLAAKGVVYARIRKGADGRSAVYHVFGTHLQSGDNPTAAGIRVSQLTQMRDVVRRLAIPNTEAVLFAGDFNVDGIQDTVELRRMITLLDASRPAERGVQRATSDPSTNALVGQSGDAQELGCQQQYQHTGRCSCCRPQRLDYVLMSNQHLLPASALAEVVVLKAAKPFPACISAPLQPHFVYATSSFCKRKWSLSDLSDHYPVLATIEFATSPVR